MKKVYTKSDLENMEDRYEFLFPVPYKTNTVPDRLMELRDTSFSAINDRLIKADFSLIVYIPKLPVINALKQADVLSESASFRLLRIPPQKFNSAIEEFLLENATSVNFFWIQDNQKLEFVLPKTSYERIKLLNMNQNELCSFWLEDGECTIATWN